MRKEQNIESAPYKIYIVISQTNTMVSRVIRLFTKDPYNHSSISLNESLTDMYSFGRKYHWTPLPGGFIQESIYKKVFAHHPDTTIAVYEVEVTKAQYRKVKKTLKQMQKNQKKYAYNLIGVMLVALHKERKAANKYYCSEFVKYILTECDIVEKSELPKLCKPMDFQLVNGVKIFEGSMINYGCT